MLLYTNSFPVFIDSAILSNIRVPASTRKQGLCYLVLITLSWMILMLLYTNSFTVFINSTILSNNQHYLNHLHLFLVPEVGYSSQWLLCYRQSSHGDSDTTFHEKCDGKEKTVTIVQEKEFVFGGYTDIPWGNCNCFIFS